MKNLNKCVCAIALLIYSTTIVQQAEATKRITSSQDDERPSKISKNDLEDLLGTLKKGSYLSSILIKKTKDLSLPDLKSYGDTISVDHELFDSWIRLILMAFPDTPDFRINLHEAKIKAEGERATPEAQNNLGYMYHRGQGVTQDHSEAFKVSRSSDIKYYDIYNQSFLTFGQKNIEIADKLRKMTLERDVSSLFFEPIDEIIELHKQSKRNYQTHALEIQTAYRNGLIPEEQVVQKKEEMKDRNTLIEQVDQEIEVLTKLRTLPQEMENLLLEGIPYRNKLFLQNNAHIASLFED